MSQSSGNTKKVGDSVSGKDPSIAPVPSPNSNMVDAQASVAINASLPNNEGKSKNDSGKNTAVSSTNQQPDTMPLTQRPEEAEGKDVNNNLIQTVANDKSTDAIVNENDTNPTESQPDTIPLTEKPEASIVDNNPKPKNPTNKKKNTQQVEMEEYIPTEDSLEGEKDDLNLSDEASLGESDNSEKNNSINEDVSIDEDDQSEPKTIDEEDENFVLNDVSDNVNPNNYGK